MPFDQEGHDPSSGEGGFALLIVLWTIALVSMLFLAFVTSVRTHTKLASNALGAASLEAYADAGVSIAILDLVRTARLPPEQRRFPHTSEAVVCRIADDTVLAISVQDEEGRFDLNTAAGPILASLIEALGVNAFDASRYVDALLDFRDADDLRRVNGAEHRDYQLAGARSGPKDSPFDTIDELHQVLGLPTPLVQRLKPFVTVHSNRSGIDPNVAPRALLRLLVGRAGSGPNQPLLPYAVTSTGRLFAVRVEASRIDGNGFVREATVERKRAPNGSYQLHRWARGGASQSSAEPSSSHTAALPDC